MADNSTAFEATARAEATQKTVNQWREKPMEWGKVDCVRMIVSHLRRFGIRPKLAKAGKWDSPMTAHAAMRRHGHKNLVDALDDIQGLTRQNGAQAILGDLAVIEADHLLGSACVCIGPNQWLGLHEAADGFTVIQITEFLASWRVEWRRRLTKLQK